MGRLVDGVWVTDEQLTKSTDGKYQREESAYRRWITSDGQKDGFKAESGRYHIYASLACPWANRALCFRMLKGLENAITVSYVDPVMTENGWSFGQETMDNIDTKDPLFGFNFLHQVYTKANAKYSGRVTVPVLWDKQQNTIVSNESAEIIRMFNSEFTGISDPNTPDYYPESLRPSIDDMNAMVYKSINNGVYRAGFATTQSAYEEAVNELFNALDQVDVGGVFSSFF